MKVAALQLPVVVRELTELAQRKSTYRLRCLGVGIPLFVCFICLTILQVQAESTLDLIGSGQTLHTTLYVTLLCVIYLLAPALSCSAITAEKQKQTWGLLLISRLPPFSLILEKICSRIVPLFSLVIGSAPLFGIAFLMGGVTVVDTLGAIGCLFFVVLQVTIVAVAASSVMKTDIGAYWASNITLVLMYFAWPLLAEANILPRQGPTSKIDDWFFLFPPYQQAVLCDMLQWGASTTSQVDLFWVTVPSLLITASFFIIGWRAVIFMGDTGGFTFGAVSQFLFEQKLRLFTLGHRFKSRVKANQPTANSPDGPDGGSMSPLYTSKTTHPELKQDHIWSHFEAAYHPIFWRERSTMPLISRRILLCVLTLLSVLFLAVWAGTQASDQTEEGAAFILSSLVVVLLVMVSLATRSFTRERDQETLEALLATPLSNREILQQKMAALDTAAWYLISPVLLVTCESAMLSETALHRDGLFVFTVCIASHTLLYLHVVKWIGIWFSLRMNTTMKAMVASLASILILCTVPLAICITYLISSDISPDEHMWWFYASPVIVPMLGAFRDLGELYQNNNMPDSGLLCIMLNLGLYFGLMQTLKVLTIRNLTQLLQRRDQDSPPPALPMLRSP